MQKIWKRATKVGIAVGLFGLFCTLLSSRWIGNRITDGINRVKRHHFESEYFGLNALGDMPLDQDNQRWLEKAMKETSRGQLVCMRRKPEIEKEIPVQLEKVDEEGSEAEPSKVPNKRKVSISQLSPTRAIGCCPAGNPFGTVYRPGFACCNDIVFDVSTQFCCTKMDSTKLLPLNDEGLNYCHPPDGIPYCRLEDFEMSKKLPMTYNCQNNSNGKPEFCEFFCPVGSKPMDGIASASCYKDGIWDAKPLCCQGCREDFQLDLWFLIQVPEFQNKDHIRRLKEFLKDFLSYLPISQENVRVGFDLISSDFSTDTAIWDLASHNNHEDVNSTIDILSFKGFGSEIGTGLTWLGKNGFTPSMGDRGDVSDLAIVILHDPSDDDIFDGARTLKEKTDVMVIAIGQDITNDDLSVIASNRDSDYRVDRKKMMQLSPKLHENICGDDCV